ncbi:hypothetical protein SUNI508_03303 [Seiridium unicorne]|uniref:Uncharacterized protein n=1 Tax=Seiridium unicorne TaxID=138068 RepID=A0ABR2VE34_9PEZI
MQLPELEKSKAPFANLSPPSSSFAPINLNDPLAFVPETRFHDVDSSLAELEHEVTGHGEEIVPKTQELHRHQLKLKRKLSVDDGPGTSKRLTPQPSTPASSPFQTLKITNLGPRGRGFAVTKQVQGSDYIMSTTVGNALTQSQHLAQKTTMDHMTARSTHSSRGHKSASATSRGSNDHAHARIAFGIDTLHSPLSAPLQDTPSCNSEVDDVIYPSSDTLADLTEGIATQSCEVDEYGCDEILEEDMMHMVDEPVTCHQDHIPPSSLVDHWDRDSRSADEYDPNLQYSSRPASSDLENKPCDMQSEHYSAIQEDLLDDDVDWDAVYTITQALPKDPASIGSGEALALQSTLVDLPSPDEVAALQVGEDPALSPFTRPPFPEKVRDRSPIPGVSSETVLRTCFRIGHLISQAVYCYQNHQEAVFELYARVTYSSREALAHKQHFQFTDLFKDQQPYPSGMLTGWRVGSPLDRQSQGFVNTRKPKLCWCMCSLRRDHKASIGWIIEIRAIRETTWEQIHFAKVTLCGTEDQYDGKLVNMPEL